MEAEEIQPQASKFPRIGNGTGRNTGTAEMGSNDLQYPKGDEGVRPKGKIDKSAPIRGWHHNSWILRVSRASGGKDRHSKVLTSKGLRDRRVRLSVPTAIQFYDIQDRLGYKQPSKVVEWLIKEAADSISESPSWNDSFVGCPTGQQQSSDEKRTSEGNATEQLDLGSVDVVEMDGDPNPNSLFSEQNQNLSLSKSACNSLLETSKGSSGLSLSRTEMHNNRVHARERARERTAKEKKDSGSNQQPLNLIPQSSFTKLLEGGIGLNNTVNRTTTSNGRPSASGHQDYVNGARQWSSAAMDYFTSGLLSCPLSRNSSRLAAGQLQMASNQIPQALPIPPFTVSSGGDGGNHHELPPPQYSFVHEGFIPLAATASSTGPEYNLNFMISSSLGSPAAGLGGFNGGTLQSKSTSQQSFLSHLQRFSTMEGPSSSHHQNIGMPFLIGTAVPLDNHNYQTQFPPGFNGRLQPYNGPDEKEKPKS